MVKISIQKVMVCIFFIGFIFKFIFGHIVCSLTMKITSRVSGLVERWVIYININATTFWASLCVITILIGALEITLNGTVYGASIICIFIFIVGNICDFVNAQDYKKNPDSYKRNTIQGIKEAES